jgi:hypothetical protein
MAFPVGWPPRPSSGARSIRFFVDGTATANFSDSAWLFSQDTGAQTVVPMPNVRAGDNTTVAHVGDLTAGGSPMGGGTNLDPATVPMIWSYGMRVVNDSTADTDLEISFDGVNIHDKLKKGEEVLYRNRIEAGISVRGAGALYRISAY